MSSHTAIAPTDTPKRVRHSFDKIVGRLNTRWDLELPSIHGTQESALQQADVQHSLARRCSGQIRYLCFRDCQLDKVIQDFEASVAPICSQWVWKRSQEEGTLPKMPVTKSFLSTRPALPRKHRQELLQRLFELLNEEFTLARDSEVYKRTSFTATCDAAGSFQGNEGQDNTSISTSRIAAPEIARRQLAGAAVGDTEDVRAQSRRSREATKRKSSGSEKVRSQAVIKMSLNHNPS